jgi:hypothetical protein
MTERYLWDASGDPDPEVEHLERVLSVLGEPSPLGELPPSPSRSYFPRIPHLVAAACAALAVIVLAWFVWRPASPDWVVTPEAGTPRVGSKAVTGSTKLRVGDWLDTDQQSKARISFGRLAILDVQPNTSLQVTQSRTSEYRISLQKGKLNAVIFAPPNRFFVDTPAAVAIDLGCTYTVEINAEGNSVVHVKHGLVSVQSHGLASYILAGAVCVARKNTAPDTPYFCDAPPVMISALKDFDAHSSSESLQAILASARKKDALSLWHMIPKTNGPERAEVVDRLAGLVSLPAGVTRDGVMQQNKTMLGQWWTSIRAEITPP